MIPRKKIAENADIQRLVEQFSEKFSGKTPQFAVTAPGRVNLIGEHVDYCGYSVFPMALNRSIRMAVHVDEGGDGLTLANVNADYKTFESSNFSIPIDQSNIEWHLYFVCGYRTIEGFAKAQGKEMPKMRLTVLVDGDIPPNAGLSSSSALVVASAMAVAEAAGFDIARSELAALCARGEHHIGTQGGGMDQAAALLSEEGKALLINFTDPIEALPRTLPSDVKFVIANSMVAMNKAASNQFNQRVVECRVAAKLLVNHHAKKTAATKSVDGQDGSTPDWRKISHLRDAQDAVGADDPQSVLDYVYRTLIHESEIHAGDKAIDEQTLPDYEDSHGTWTREQIMRSLGCSDQEFNETVLTPNTKDVNEFHIGPRARHVFSEAERALHFANLCLSLEGGHPEACEPGVSHETVVKEMGILMNKSHHSCSLFYQCSHPEVDKLVEIAQKNGSHGSRLTGAGWGGNTVHMVDAKKVNAFVEALDTEYYAPRHLKASEAVFICEPGPCATIFK